MKSEQKTVRWWYQQEHPGIAVDCSVEEGQYKHAFHLGWERETEVLKTGLYLHEASVYIPEEAFIYSLESGLWRACVGHANSQLCHKSVFWQCLSKRHIIQKGIDRGLKQNPLLFMESLGEYVVIFF